MENKSLNRLARRVLYSMKKEYGNKVDVYKMVSSDTDHLTGEITVVKQVTRIRKAIVMPSALIRDVGQTISVISSDKQFVYGGAYDLSSRIMVLDPVDLPKDFEICPTDYIAYKHSRWDVVQVVKDEGLNGAWIVTVKNVPNMPVYEIIDILVSSDMALVEEVGNDPLAQQLKTKLNLASDLHVIRYHTVSPVVTRLKLQSDVERE
jgi:hypothetical protein